MSKLDDYLKKAFDPGWNEGARRYMQLQKVAQPPMGAPMQDPQVVDPGIAATTMPQVAVNDQIPVQGLEAAEAPLPPELSPAGVAASQAAAQAQAGIDSAMLNARKAEALEANLLQTKAQAQQAVQAAAQAQGELQQAQQMIQQINAELEQSQAQSQESTKQLNVLRSSLKKYQAGLMDAVGQDPETMMQQQVAQEQLQQSQTQMPLMEAEAKAQEAQAKAQLQQSQAQLVAQQAAGGAPPGPAGQQGGGAPGGPRTGANPPGPGGV